MRCWVSVQASGSVFFSAISRKIFYRKGRNMPKEFLTDEAVEEEIERLRGSELVAS